MTKALIVFNSGSTSLKFLAWLGVKLDVAGTASIRACFGGKPGRPPMGSARW